MDKRLNHDQQKQDPAQGDKVLLVNQLIKLICMSSLALIMATPLVSAKAEESKAYYQAMELYHQKKWDQAKETFKKYQQHYPKSKWQASVQLRLADMAEAPSEAINGYKLVLKEHGETEWAKDARWGLASTYFTLGQYKKVISMLSTVKNTASSRGLSAIYITALALLALKDYEQAKATFQSLINKSTLDNFKENALVGLGDAYVGLKDYQQALITYGRYLTDYPNGRATNHVLNQKSQLLSKQGSHDDALAAMHQLATRYPDSFEAEKVKGKLSQDDASDKYTIQVGSFSQTDYAAKLVKRLRNKGYNAYQLKARRQDDVFIQVRVGHYTTKAFAHKIAEKLKEKEKLPFVIVPYIKPD